MDDEILFATGDGLTDAEELKTTTIEDVEATPKRKRGRPRKNVVSGEDTGASVESTPKPKPRVRRTTKLKGADVAAGVEMISTVVAGMGGEAYAHWPISQEEFAPVADGWADLLNRIPSQYVRGAFDLAGYGSLAVMTYFIIGPRIAATQAIKAQQKAQASGEDDTVSATGGVAYGTWNN